jgi:hypothetical protein
MGMPAKAKHCSGPFPVETTLSFVTQSQLYNVCIATMKFPHSQAIQPTVTNYNYGPHTGRGQVATRPNLGPRINKNCGEHVVLFACHASASPLSLDPTGIDMAKVQTVRTIVTIPKACMISRGDDGSFERWIETTLVTRPVFISISLTTPHLETRPKKLCCRIDYRYSRDPRYDDLLASISILLLLLIDQILITKEQTGLKLVADLPKDNWSCHRFHGLQSGGIARPLRRVSSLFNVVHGK